MAGGLSLVQLKEQIDTNHSTINEALEEINNRQDKAEERQKQSDEKLNRMQSSLEALMATCSTQFEWIRQQLSSQSDSTSTPLVDVKGKGILESPVSATMGAVTEQPLNRGLSTGSSFTAYKVPKFDFPHFNGEDVLGWLQQCNGFFLLNPMSEDHKVLFMSMHLDGKARKWLNTTFSSLTQVSWAEFREAALQRFSQHGCNNLVAQLNHLEQKGSVEEYQTQFEDLRALVLEREPLLTESYFVSSFLGGLQLEIQNMVQMFKPSTLDQTIALARLCEGAVDRVILKARNPSEYQNSTYQQPSELYNPNVQAVTVRNDTKMFTEGTIKQPSTTAAVPLNKITNTELQKRRERGLCYYCDEVYVPGHRCKRVQAFQIIGEDEENHENEGEAPMEAEDKGKELIQVTEPEISLQALNGYAPYQTMILQGMSKKIPLSILVDSGSTHNFLDPTTAKQIGCSIVATNSLMVTVADGSKVCSKAMCPHFQWSAQGEAFKTEVRLLPLGGYSMILGVQWLKEVGPVTLDLNKLTLGLFNHGTKVQLQGVTNAVPSIKVITGATLFKLCAQQECSFFGHLQFTPEEQSVKEPLPTSIAELIDQYNHIFKEPTGRPPPRL